MDKAEELSEQLRREPCRLLTNDCIIKSIRFKKACRRLGISARMVLCLGKSRARIMGRRLSIPVVHAWGEVDGKRMEVSRTLGAEGMWGIVPVEFQPLVRVRI